MRKRFVPVFVAAIAALALVACDDGDSSGSDMTSNTATGTNTNTSGGDTSMTTDTSTGGGDGTTPCFSSPAPETFCQAGQYCEDPLFAMCTNGCLNDMNCASNQTCNIPSGQSVGACENVGSAVTKEQVCNKLQACDPANYEQALCDQLYAGTNATCHECIANANCADSEACNSACGFN